MGEFRNECPEVVVRAPALGRLHADVEYVEQRAAGVADGGDDLLEALFPVVFDDDEGGGGEVGADVRVELAGIGDGRRNAVVNETSGQRAAFDEELHLEGTR